MDFLNICCGGGGCTLGCFIGGETVCNIHFIAVDFRQRWFVPIRYQAPHQLRYILDHHPPANTQYFCI